MNILKALQDRDHLIVPTNGVVKKDGSLVMGGGIAKFVRDNFVEVGTGKRIDKVLGELVNNYGNKPYFILACSRNKQIEVGIISFPTKKGLVRTSEISPEEVLPKYRRELYKRKFIEGWKLKSDLSLIIQSFEELLKMISRNPLFCYTLYLPLVGVGLGGLDEEDVLPVYREYVFRLRNYYNKVVVFTRNGTVKV